MAGPGAAERLNQAFESKLFPTFCQAQAGKREGILP